MNIIFPTIITQAQSSNHNNPQAHQVPTHIHIKLMNKHDSS